MSLWKLFFSELERPREKRPLGSGWLSGCGSVLAGLTGLLLVIVLRYPGAFLTPELAPLIESTYLRIFLHVVLLLGYGLALVSLVLNRNKTLGAIGLFITMVAALLGGGGAQAQFGDATSLYFGLDFFVLNVLFTGFLFIPLERFFPHHGDQTVFRPEWQEDMFYYLVSSLLVQVLTFLSTAPANIVNNSVDISTIQTWIVGIPFLVQLLIIMAVTDFVQYWLHRAFHQIPFLWKFHSIHHSAKSMDWLAGARMHFLEIAVLRGVTALPMLTLGFDPAAVQTYVLIVYFYSSLVHANIGWDLGLVEKLLVTPRFHHWHHGKERAAIDVNFAIHFPLYDRLFGTHHMPDDKSWPNGYGVAGGGVPNGYWQQFLHPFRRQKPKS